jgi:hypothetical protein
MPALTPAEADKEFALRVEFVEHYTQLSKETCAVAVKHVSPNLLAACSPTFKAAHPGDYSTGDDGVGRYHQAIRRHEAAGKRGHDVHAAVEEEIPGSSTTAAQSQWGVALDAAKQARAGSSRPDSGYSLWRAERVQQQADAAEAPKTASPPAIKTAAT